MPICVYPYPFSLVPSIHSSLYHSGHGLIIFYIYWLYFSVSIYIQCSNPSSSNKRDPKNETHLNSWEQWKRSWLDPIWVKCLFIWDWETSHNTSCLHGSAAGVAIKRWGMFKTLSTQQSNTIFAKKKYLFVSSIFSLNPSYKFMPEKFIFQRWGSCPETFNSLNLLSSKFQSQYLK